MNQKKYQLIQTQIQEARLALQNWNDRRAEAGIELDSIFIEMEEYKNQMDSRNEGYEKQIIELRAKLEKSEREFHRHFEDYTNDLQELKLENEGLRAQLKTAITEIEQQKQTQKNLEIRQAREIEQISAQAKIRSAEQLSQLKNEMNNLVAEVQTLRGERKAITEKADRSEQELRGIRSQMMNFIHGASGASTNEAPIIAAKNETPVAIPVINQIQAKNSEEIVITNSGSPATTVDEYLRRFGY